MGFIFNVSVPTSFSPTVLCWTSESLSWPTHSHRTALIHTFDSNLKRVPSAAWQSEHISLVDSLECELCADRDLCAIPGAWKSVRYTTCAVSIRHVQWMCMASHFILSPLSSDLKFIYHNLHPAVGLTNCSTVKIELIWREHPHTPTTKSASPRATLSTGSFPLIIIQLVPAAV